MGVVEVVAETVTVAKKNEDSVLNDIWLVLNEINIFMHRCPILNKPENFY